MHLPKDAKVVKEMSRQGDEAHASIQEQYLITVCILKYVRLYRPIPRQLRLVVVSLKWPRTFYSGQSILSKRRGARNSNSTKLMIRGPISATWVRNGGGD